MIEKDEHPTLPGTDSAAKPVEFLPATLAGCLTACPDYHAAERETYLKSVESSHSGNIDLLGLLRLDENVRKGLQDLKTEFKVKDEATESQLGELMDLAQRRSPIFDVATNKVPVIVSFAV